jgi:enoyl-CoA hydratase/carnithine racemase
MQFSTMSFETLDEIGLVTFTQPNQLNSIGEERLAELEQLLDAVEQDKELAALILTGTGNAFCVGLDLALLDKAFDDIPYFERTVRRLARIIARIEALEIPTISAVNGFARAGGFELTLGCDFMIIANEAKIGDVHTDSGVVPACVSLRLARRIGQQRAKEVLWTARWYQGPEAVEIGLALKSVPLADLRAEAINFARSMTDKPRAAIASLKRLFIGAMAEDVQHAAEQELRSFVEYMSTQPYGREGYRAFREKRQPEWKLQKARKRARE